MADLGQPAVTPVVKTPALRPSVAGTRTQAQVLRQNAGAAQFALPPTKQGTVMEFSPAFLDGFEDKCAAAGCDPDLVAAFGEQLDQQVKQAQILEGAGTGAGIGAALGFSHGWGGGFGRWRMSNAMDDAGSGALAGAGVGAAIGALRRLIAASRAQEVPAEKEKQAEDIPPVSDTNQTPWSQRAPDMWDSEFQLASGYEDQIARDAGMRVPTDAPKGGFSNAQKLLGALAALGVVGGGAYLASRKRKKNEKQAQNIQPSQAAGITAMAAPGATAISAHQPAPGGNLVQSAIAKLKALYARAQPHLPAAAGAALGGAGLLYGAHKLDQYLENRAVTRALSGMKPGATTADLAADPTISAQIDNLERLGGGTPLDQASRERLARVFVRNGLMPGGDPAAKTPAPAAEQPEKSAAAVAIDMFRADQAYKAAQFRLPQMNQAVQPQNASMGGPLPRVRSSITDASNFRLPQMNQAVQPQNALLRGPFQQVSRSMDKTNPAQQLFNGAGVGPTETTAAMQDAGNWMRRNGLYPGGQLPQPMANALSSTPLGRLTNVSPNYAPVLPSDKPLLNGMQLGLAAVGRGRGGLKTPSYLGKRFGLQ